MPNIKVAFPTDEHYPFEDKKAVELAQKIVHDFKPDVLIRGSDALDFYSVSSFLKSRKVYAKTLQDEIDAWKVGERSWADVAPDADKPFLMGNHEERLQRYLLTKARELEGLSVLEFEKLLDFERFGLYTPKNNEVVVDRKLLIKHGTIVRKYSAYTAKAELEKEMYGITVMAGHTHRGGAHYATTRTGVVAAYEGFCLCDINQSYIKGTANWQQGILLATVRPVGVQVDAVQFFRKGSKLYAYFRDKEYIV